MDRWVLRPVKVRSGERPILADPSHYARSGDAIPVVREADYDRLREALEELAATVVYWAERRSTPEWDLAGKAARAALKEERGDG